MPASIDDDEAPEPRSAELLAGSSGALPASDIGDDLSQREPGDSSANAPEEATRGDGGLPERMVFREFVAGAAVVLAVAGGVAAKHLLPLVSESPTEAQCEKLLERWLDHASRQHDPLVDDSEVALAGARARTAPEYVTNLERCQSQLTAEEVDCAVGAPNADAIERCVQ